MVPLCGCEMDREFQTYSHSHLPFLSLFEAGVELGVGGRGAEWRQTSLEFTVGISIS